MHLAQKLLGNVQCSGSSRSSAKRMSVEDENHSRQPLEVDNNQLRAITEIGPLTTIREAAKENINHSTVIQHLKQIG